MIAIARERLANQPSPQLRFAVADAEAPVFGCGVFDAVLAFNVLHLATDLDAALQQVVLALRPRGADILETISRRNLGQLRQGADILAEIIEAAHRAAPPAP